jgi:hypothetical protein
MENEGELQKRIKELMYEDNSIDDGFDVLSYIDAAKKEFPLNPIITAIKLYKNLRNYKEEEQQILIKEHLKNCNLERFILETIDWFIEKFGEASE